MRKNLTSFLAVSACCLSFIATAAAQEAQPANNVPTTTKVAQAPISTNKKVDIKAFEQPVEKITAAEMQKRLEVTALDDVIYIKVSEEEVQVYKNISKNSSLRKQIIYMLPEAKMLHVYATNQKSGSQMYKTLRHFQGYGTNVNGYRVVTEKDNTRMTANGNPVYHYWCMKVERPQVIYYNPGWDYPIGIDIGWGWGWHHGPWGPGPWGGLHGGPHGGHGPGGHGGHHR